jgi:outer membrane cobalamin receptor
VFIRVLLPHFVSAFLLLCAIPRAASAATISGTVTDPDRRPMRDVRIVASLSDLAVATATTNAEGRFTIEGLPAGEFTLLALRDGFRAVPSRVTVGVADERDVTISMAISAVSEALVVSASQVDVPLSRTTDSVTVIPSSTIAARQIASVGDALRWVPGIAVARSGGHGALTSVFSRGGESDYTLVLIDGIKVNAFGGFFDFSQLAIGDVEQVEIVRGPQSALFGSDAIGGVVQMVTRRGGPLRANGLFEAGAFGTVRSAGSASGSVGAFGWNVSAEGWRSDGFTGVAPATGERVSNDDGMLAEGGFGAEWTHAKVGDVRFDGRVSNTERGFPGPFGSNPIGAYTNVDTISRGDRDRKLFGVRYSTFFGETRRVRQRVIVSDSAIDGRFVSAFDPEHPATDGTHRLDVRLQTDATLGSRIALSGGLEHTRERGESSFVLDANRNATDITRRVTGYFGELRINDGGRLFVTSGVRIEDIHRDPVPTNGSSRPAFPAESIVSTNPKFAVTYFLRPESNTGGSFGWTRARVTAGTGIRPPDTFDIAFTDNPALKPERSRSVDAGISQAFGGGALVADVTAFANHYDDLIVTVGREQSDASRYRTDNISNARARGVELSLSARAPFGLELQGGYTWLSTKILPVDGASGLAPSPFAVGDPLIRRPRHQGSFAATLTRNRMSAYIDTNGRSEVLDIEPSFGALFGGLFPNPGYMTWNAGGSVRVVRGVDVYARVQNLFDRSYEEVFGYPALGRAATIGVRVAGRR